MPPSSRTGEQVLEEPWRSRPHQMARAGCDADKAFAILRESSSHQNVKLNVVAQRMVNRVSDPQPHRDGVQPGEVSKLLLDSEPSDLNSVSTRD